ncbi:hypothetical protein ACQKWADRAFT_212074 [Trichoderma austrokoningii]
MLCLRYPALLSLPEVSLHKVPASVLSASSAYSKEVESRRQSARRPSKGLKTVAWRSDCTAQRLSKRLSTSAGHLCHAAAAAVVPESVIAAPQLSLIPALLKEQTLPAGLYWGGPSPQPLGSARRGPSLPKWRPGCSCSTPGATQGCPHREATKQVATGQDSGSTRPVMMQS